MMVDSFLLLVGAPVLALILLGLAWKARLARKRATQIWAPFHIAAKRGKAGPWLVGTAALLAGVGAAGPRWGQAVTEMEGRALNLAIGIDVSRSMLAEDVKPNRLQRSIAEARRLVQDARGDRIALLAFAGRSYILTPLTLDDGAVELQLDALDPDVASEGGTDLAAVIAQGRGLLGAAAEGGARVLVVFTDGETHDSLGAAVTAASTLRSEGITLILVGEGDSLPARIPLRDEQGTFKSWKTDDQGTIVRTWRHDEVLRAVADAGGGVLVGAETADQEGTVRRVLAGLERAATRERRRADLIPRGWMFALAATLVLAGQILLRRGPALAVILLGLGLASPAPAQRPSSGDRLLRRGDTSGAALAWFKDAKKGAGADTALFNAGTAALARGELAAAKEWLAGASRSLDPGLAFRASYNLGLAALIESRRDTAQRKALEEEAAGHFRSALLLDPRSREAKWNLELVQDRAPPPSGGGGGTPPPKPQPQAPPRPNPSGSSSLSQTEAAQILSSVDRAERDVRADQARRRRVAQSSSGRDW